QLRRADQAMAIRDLHRLTDRIRFLYGAGNFPRKYLRAIDANCRIFWDDRGRLVERLSPNGLSALEPAVRDDLLDLAICCADLRGRLAPPGGNEKGREQAIEVLSQAEALVGSSPVLDEERVFYSDPRPARKPQTKPLTAWEHCALGRSLLRAGELER